MVLNVNERLQKPCKSDWLQAMLQVTLGCNVGESFAFS